MKDDSNSRQAQRVGWSDIMASSIVAELEHIQSHPVRVASPRDKPIPLEEWLGLLLARDGETRAHICLLGVKFRAQGQSQMVLVACAAHTVPSHRVHSKAEASDAQMIIGRQVITIPDLQRSTRKYHRERQ